MFATSSHTESTPPAGRSKADPARAISGAAIAVNTASVASANALVHRVCLVSFMRADEPPVLVQMLEHRGVQVHGDDVREGGDVGAERVDHMARLGLQSAEGLTGANCVRREGSQRRGVRDRRRTALRRAADRSQTLGDQIGSWLTSHSRAVSVAMRKSPHVAKSKSSLVAS